MITIGASQEPGVKHQISRSEQFAPAFWHDRPPPGPTTQGGAAPAEGDRPVPPPASRSSLFAKGLPIHAYNPVAPTATSSRRDRHQRIPRACAQPTARAAPNRRGFSAEDLDRPVRMVFLIFRRANDPPSWLYVAKTFVVAFAYKNGDLKASGRTGGDRLPRLSYTIGVHFPPGHPPFSLPKAKPPADFLASVPTLPRVPARKVPRGDQAVVPNTCAVFSRPGRRGRGAAQCARDRTRGQSSR